MLPLSQRLLAAALSLLLLASASPHSQCVTDSPSNAWLCGPTLPGEALHQWRDGHWSCEASSATEDECLGIAVSPFAKRFICGRLYQPHHASYVVGTAGTPFAPAGAVGYRRSRPHTLCSPDDKVCDLVSGAAPLDRPHLLDPQDAAPARRDPLEVSRLTYWTTQTRPRLLQVHIFCTLRSTLITLATLGWS